MRIYSKKGFTLIEAIVTITVMSIVAFTVMYISTEAFRIYVVNKNYIRLRADGRYAFSRIVYEIRQAEEITGFPPSNKKISIRSDVDNDGFPEFITYEWSGNLLTRKQDGPGAVTRTWTICSNVNIAAFGVVDNTWVNIGLDLKLGSEHMRLWTTATTRSSVGI